MKQNNMKKCDILIIGGGNMGCALASGLLHQKDISLTIKTRDNAPIALEPNERVFITSDFNHINFSDNPTIILSVKPHHITNILQEIAPILETVKSPLIVSVAAGFAYDTLCSHLPAHCTVIRSMPNTPVAIGCGLIGYYAEKPNLEFEHLFSACGKVIYFSDEEKLHGFTALAGSGPAYLFHFIEALSLAAEHIGFDADNAMMMARQTIIGASLLAYKQPEKTASQLRKNVTSVGGTTQAGLCILMGNDNLLPEGSLLTDILIRTLQSAQNRSLALAKG